MAGKLRRCAATGSPSRQCPVSREADEGPDIARTTPMTRSSRQSRGEASLPLRKRTASAAMPTNWYDSAGGGLSGRTDNRKISAGCLVKPQPNRKLPCHLAVTLYRNCLSYHGAPSDMTEIDGDKISDIAPTDEIDGESWVLEAHIHVQAFQQQPHDAEFRTARRHAGKIEAHDHAMIRQRSHVCQRAFPKAPRQENGIKVGRLDPVARMRQSPKTQRGHDWTQLFACWRKPVLMTGSVGA